MILTILQHTPLWVWALLALLLALGLAQWRDRQLSRRRIVLAPLPLMALGFSTLWPSLQQLPLAAAVWLACALAAGAAARRWLAPRCALWDAATQRLFVPGSAGPMLLILATFLLKYSIGVAQGLQPQLATQSSFLLAVASVSGVVTGLWAGRTLAMLRLTHPSASTTMPRHALALDA